MLRFILRGESRQRNGFVGEWYETVDVTCPELEARLRAGGFGEDIYEAVSLVGVEVLKEERE